MATKVFCFRANEELSAWIENQAYLDGITEAQFIHRAVERYRAFTPKDRERWRDETLLFELRLCGHYLYHLVEKAFGDQLKASLPQVKRNLRQEVAALLDALDQGEED